MYHQQKNFPILTEVHSDSAKLRLVKLAAACGVSSYPTHQNKIISCG